MKKIENLLSLLLTVKNFWVVLCEHVRPGKDGLFKIFTWKNQVVYCRKNTSDYHEVISVLSGREYPLSLLHLPKSPLVIDIGAHIGTFDLCIKQTCPSARILAFEPNPSNFTLLHKNIRANRLQSITTVNAAISSTVGIVKLYVHPETPNEGTLLGGNTCIDVQALSLSEVVRTHKLKKIDVLKLDCEGSEYDILDKLPNHVRIDHILAEYHILGEGKNLASLRQHLKKEVSHCLPQAKSGVEIRCGLFYSDEVTLLVLRQKSLE